MMTEAQVCERMRAGTAEQQRVFAAELKRIWREREKNAGVSAFARTFGCDVRLVRFYEAGDFERACAAVMQVS